MRTSVRNRNSAKHHSIVATLVLSLWFPLASTAELRIDKVEPPFWWVGMQDPVVQLMLYGEDLKGSEISSTEPGIQVLQTHDTDNPGYLFVDLKIAPSLSAGDYALRVERGQETATHRYPLKERAPTENRHQGFNASDVIYLITPDRFSNGDPKNDRAPGTLDEYDPKNPKMRHGGDLRGIINRLDYLADLGVTTLWLNPVLENRGINSYHGYKTTDRYRIDPRFGSNETYDELVREAHAHGLKVIFDNVNNHIGLKHPWMANLPTKDWVNGSIENHESEKHYLLSITDPHRAPNSLKQLKEFWFVDAMPDLNQRNQHLSQYLTQNTLWWIERSGLDGIREDTYPYADQAFLTKWAQTVRAHYPRFSVVGEIWATAPAYLAHFQEGSRMPDAIPTHLPSVMDFPLKVAFQRFLKKEGKLRDIYQVFAQDFLYPAPNQLLVFLDNHDTPRALLEAEGDLKRVQLALTILLTARGIPQLLYGTEIAMQGGRSHVEVRADFPGGFPGDQRSAFTKEGREENEQAMHSFVRRLLHLRKKHPALQSGKLIHYPPTWNSDVYIYFKKGKDGTTFLILANGHEEKRSVDLSELAPELKEFSTWRDLMSDQENPLNPNGFSLEPLETRIYQLK